MNKEHDVIYFGKIVLAAVIVRNNTRTSLIIKALKLERPLLVTLVFVLCITFTLSWALEVVEQDSNGSLDSESMYDKIWLLSKPSTKMGTAISR
jgi:hypothetical protein